MRPVTRLSVAAVALAASLSACVSVLPEPQAPNALYRFGPMEVSHTLGVSLSVREPGASRLVGGRAIASEDASGAIRYVPGVEWADSATRMMQLALLDSLGGSGGGVAVQSGMGSAMDYELAWRLSDFSLAGETARCRIEATLLDGRSREPVAQTTVTASADARSRDNPDRTKALADAGRACVADVADFVASVTGEGPGA